jgi:hypothetical protein
LNDSRVKSVAATGHAHSKVATSVRVFYNFKYANAFSFFDYPEEENALPSAMNYQFQIYPEAHSGEL